MLALNPGFSGDAVSGYSFYSEDLEFIALNFPVAQMAWKVYDANLVEVASQTFNLNLIKPMATVTLTTPLIINYDVGINGG